MFCRASWRGYLVLFYLLLSAASVLASEIILPKDDFAPGWKRSGKTAAFIKTDLFNYIDGGAELFLEFGFEKLYVQRYARGKSELTLEVYKMDSPESALGIYLMKCGLETPAKGIPARNSAEKLQFTILKNKFLIFVNNFQGDEKNLPAMKALAQKTLEPMPEGPAVKLLEQLPNEGLVKDSQRLIRGPVALQPFYTFGEGDIFQLRGKIFGVLANYGGEGNAVYSRLIIPYLDHKQALSAYENLKANLDPYLKILTTRANGFVFSDFKQKYGVVELKEARLDIRFNLKAVPKG